MSDKTNDQTNDQKDKRGRGKVAYRRLALLSACVEEKHSDVRTIKNETGKLVAYFVDLGDGKWTEILADTGQPREKSPMGYTSSMSTIRDWEDDLLDERFHVKWGDATKDVADRKERNKIRHEVAKEELETHSWTVDAQQKSASSSPSKAPSAEA